jgi:lysozyme
MAGTSVLREFMVRLGFSVDDAQFRRFQESMSSVSKGALSVVKSFAQVGGALGVTALAADTMATKVASSLEPLYFAAQRLGSSATQIKAYQLALQQVGISAEETQGMIQGFANARATNPGLNVAFGIDPRQQNQAIAFRQALARIESGDDGSAFARVRALNLASQIGISQEQYTTLWNNRNAIQNQLLPTAGRIMAKHPNFEQDVNRSHSFENVQRNMEANLELTGDDIFGKLEPHAEKLVGATDKLIDAFNRLNNAAGGLAGEAVVGASLIGTFLASLGGIKALGGLLKGGSAGAAEGAAAGEGTGAAAAAVGGGLLSVAVSMVAPVVAAVVGSHYLDKWTKGTFWDTSGEQDPGDKPQPGQPQATGLSDQWAWLKGKVQPMMSYISKGVTDFVAGFEGHAKNGYGVYKDVGGHETAGIGHLVKPGENFQNLDKQGAMALLGRDLASATAAVKSMVHVALNENQMKALTDFVFNLGAGNLQKSTLLKELNAGHYEAAAARFEDYNKVLMNGHYVVNQGLAQRRATEAETFRTPNSHTVNLDVKNQFNITGSNAQDTADAVASRQARVNNDMVRNSQPAVV